MVGNVASSMTSLGPSDSERTRRLAKKISDDTQLKKRLGALAAAGVAVDASSAAAIPSCARLWRKSPEIDMAAVFLLGKIANVEAAEDLLREFDRDVTDRALTKLRNQTPLFQAQSERCRRYCRQTMAEKSPHHCSSRSPIEAYMSAVDGGGGRLIWIAKSQPNRGLQVIQAMVHNREGLLALRRRADEAQRVARHGRRYQAGDGVSMIAVRRNLPTG